MKEKEDNLKELKWFLILFWCTASIKHSAIFQPSLLSKKCII